MMLDCMHIFIHPSLLHHKFFTRYEMEIMPSYLWHAMCILNLKTKGGAQAFDMSADKDVYSRGSQSIHVRKVWLDNPNETFWTTKVKGKHIWSEWLQRSEHRGLVLIGWRSSSNVKIRLVGMWQTYKEMAISQELMAAFTFNSYFKRP